VGKWFRRQRVLWSDPRTRDKQLYKISFWLFFAALLTWSPLVLVAVFMPPIVNWRRFRAEMASDKEVRSIQSHHSDRYVAEVFARRLGVLTIPSDEQRAVTILLDRWTRSAQREADVRELYNDLVVRTNEIQQNINQLRGGGRSSLME